MPDAVLCRRINPEGADGDDGADALPCVPALPKTESSVSEIALDVPTEIRGDPCLFQGSIGSAYNAKSLTDNRITHILTAAAKIAPRFKDQYQYKILNLLDAPNQNIVQHF